MSKSLRSMDPLERARAIDRRLREETKGLGYWAASDSRRAAALPKPKAEPKPEPEPVAPEVAE